MIFGTIKQIRIVTKITFLLTLLLAASAWVNAQNKDLDAQYLYTQAENSYTKNEFEKCVDYCEKAASTLGKTNTKILLLQFNAYDAILQKCPYNDLLKDRQKINDYLEFFFSNIDPNIYPKDKYFEVKKFKEDLQNSDKIMTEIEADVKWYTFEDLGLIIKKYMLGGWIKVMVADGIVKKQTTMENNFWLRSCDNNGYGDKECIDEMLKSNQRNALYNCQEYFVVKLGGYHGFSLKPTITDWYEIKLSTRPSK